MSWQKVYNNPGRTSMWKQYVHILSVILFCLWIGLISSGCAGINKAMDNSDMTTTLKMSNSVFLEPVAPEKQIAWIRIRNTTDQEHIDADLIRSKIVRKLQGKGYRITDNPQNAQFRIDANILFADLATKSLTADFATLGGFGGILGGSDGNWKTQVGGGLAGAAIGAAIGSMIKVNNYAMVIDIQLSEKVEGGVHTEIEGRLSSGQAGGVYKEQNMNRTEDFFHHKTRIAATAKQVNLKFEEAVPVLVEKISNSIAGLF
ncbi:MAG: complement resistance protein TraT [SAR324 cluster bacterium]|nr:complement resistance protein TraT [SAR324 cluster bacterium]